MTHLPCPCPRPSLGVDRVEESYNVRLRIVDGGGAVMLQNPPDREHDHGGGALPQRGRVDWVVSYHHSRKTPLHLLVA